MKKYLIGLLSVLFLNAGAIAGEHTSALSQCLISNSTAADKAVITKWVFTSLSNHPSVSSISDITDAARSSVDQEMAQIIEKFIYDTCIVELKNAIKNEGPKAIEQSIRSYVEVTGREVLKHPSIAGSVSGVARHLDAKKFFEAIMAN